MKTQTILSDLQAAFVPGGAIDTVFDDLAPDSAAPINFRYDGRPRPRSRSGADSQPPTSCAPSSR